MPILIIETANGKTIKPESISGDGKNLLRFTYSAKPTEAPWFILQEAFIEMNDGQKLIIPRSRFELTSEFVVNWNEPIAP